MVKKKDKQKANEIVSKAKQALCASLEDEAYFGRNVSNDIPVTLVYFEKEDWKWIKKHFSLLHKTGVKKNVLICLGTKSDSVHYVVVKYTGIEKVEG